MTHDRATGPTVSRRLAIGQGLPAGSDGDVTFKLPRGAHVIGARLVSNDLANDQDDRLTNHDTTVALLPIRNAGRVDSYYAVASETDRVFRFTPRPRIGRMDSFSWSGSDPTRDRSITNHTTDPTSTN
jgi:hypothetical protein